MTHMSGCNLGGAHEVAITIQDIDPFLQLPVPHQDHVADVGTGWREREGSRGAGVRGEDAILAGGAKPPGCTQASPSQAATVLS